MQKLIVIICIRRKVVKMKGGNCSFLCLFVFLVQWIVFNFPLSSASVWYGDSDSEQEGFQKIRAEKFERIQRWSRGAKNQKLKKINPTCGHVRSPGNAPGSCVARNVW